MNLFRKIPKIDQLLEDPRLEELKGKTPYPVYIRALRNTLDDVRDALRKTSTEECFQEAMDTLPTQVEKKIAAELRPHLRKVINGTGVVLHTNLGRAVLQEEIFDAMKDVVCGYSNLEYTLETGTRGSRYDHLVEKIRLITGAEDAMVVNNNAAAVMLVLSSLCKDKEVITSRGELIEIGGSFRVPAVMEQSGAHLVEVGTTNKTHGKDYAEKINENTGGLLRVHTSNYRIIGFTESVSQDELMGIRDAYVQEHGGDIPIIEDLGSGVLLDLSPFGLPYEPTVQDAVSSGMDVVTFSGDKLLGGAQAGIIVGKKKYIEKMKKNQLTRALRVDKFTLAALEQVLIAYLDIDTVRGKIPTLRMLTEDLETMALRAEALQEELNQIDAVEAEMLSITSQVGGGSLPGVMLPSYGVHVKTKWPANRVEEALRFASTPVVARIQDDHVLIDIRTIQPGERELLRQVFEEVIKELS